VSARPTIVINTDYHTDYMGVPAYMVQIGYVDCVAAAGGLPLVAPCVSDEEVRAQYVKSADGFFFIGGGDVPPALYGAEPHHTVKPQADERARVDQALVRAALDGTCPVLGICGGHQLLHIARGGSLIQHLETADAHVAPNEHDIDIVPGSRLAGICSANRISVNSRHHQAVDPSTLHESYRVTARSGDGVVEAIEAADERFVLGVQWHPEFTSATGALPDPAMAAALFGHFIEAARVHARGRGGASGASA
jgi:putative glutamine amidotransferase